MEFLEGNFCKCYVYEILSEPYYIEGCCVYRVSVSYRYDVDKVSNVNYYAPLYFYTEEEAKNVKVGDLMPRIHWIIESYFKNLKQ